MATPYPRLPKCYSVEMAWAAKRPANEPLTRAFKRGVQAVPLVPGPEFLRGQKFLKMPRVKNFAES